MDLIVRAQTDELRFSFGGGEPQLWYGPAILSRIDGDSELPLASELQLFGPIGVLLYRWSGELPSGLWSREQLRSIASQLEDRPAFDEMLCMWWEPLPAGGRQLSVAALLSTSSFEILQRCLLEGVTFSELLVRAKLEITTSALPAGFEVGSPLAVPQPLSFALARARSEGA